VLNLIAEKSPDTVRGIGALLGVQAGCLNEIKLIAISPKSIATAYRYTDYSRRLIVE
jgi:hypothetical protein